MAKATLDDLMERAKKAIEKEEAIALDVAVCNGQMFDNIKHMSWFVHKVADALIDEYNKYTHLRDQFNSNY